MIDILTYQKMQSEQGYQAPYLVQLLLEEKKTIEKESLLQSLKKYCGNVEPVEKEGSLLAFAHLDHRTRFQEATLPAQCVFAEIEDIPANTDWIAQSMFQTWDWPEMENAVTRATAAISVTDMLTGGVDRKTRLKLFHGAIRAALEHVDPVAIHWLPSQRVINPERYKEDMENDQIYYSAAVNVRMFKVEDSGERIMDTMGLCALGVPDLQCNFVNLDPSQVGILLFEYAEYLLERGDVIRNGHTVQGVGEQKWVCRHEKSMIDPPRNVIDLTPGEFAPPQST